MPLGFVDLDYFDANCDALAGRAAGTPIRIATKSVRCAALLRRILARNTLFRGLMTYSAREVAFLAERGFDDFLMGYPVVNETDIAAVAPHVAGGKTVRFMVDSEEQVAILGAAGRRAGVTFRACLDLDMSSEFPGVYFGVRRSPVRSADQALAIARRARETEGVRFDSLMGYEAQIAGLPDNVAGQGPKNALFRFLKRRSMAEIARRRGQVVHRLRNDGFTLDVVNGGGTGSIEATIREEWVTEVTVGSGFFSPVQFDSYAAFRHHPAAGYAIEITRKPVAGMYTCHGGGYTASGPAGPEKGPRPYLPEGASLLPMEGGGEVQTPVRYTGQEALDLGDPILMRYAKAGEYCERFNTLLAVSDGAIVDEYPTYRGEGLHSC